MKKKLLPLMMVGTLMLTLVGCSQSTKNNDATAENPIEMQQSKFIQALALFNRMYKPALLATAKEDLSKVDQAMKKADQAREIIRPLYENNELTDFAKSEDPESKLDQIAKHIKDASALVAEKKYEDAHEELEQVRKKLFNLRQENNIPSISDDLLIFHDIMEEVIESEKKDKEEIKKLQEALEPLAKYNANNAIYKAALDSLQKAVDELGYRDAGEEYKKAITDLKPAFINLYIKFG